MGERMNDISIYKDMLKSQLKAAETERQTHRWGVGKGGRCQWAGCDVMTFLEKYKQHILC